MSCSAQISASEIIVPFDSENTTLEFRERRVQVTDLDTRKCCRLTYKGKLLLTVW